MLQNTLSQSEENTAISKWIKVVLEFWLDLKQVWDSQELIITFINDGSSTCCRTNSVQFLVWTSDHLDRGESLGAGRGGKPLACHAAGVIAALAISSVIC